MALYNEVRPQTLSEIKGQADVVRIIRSSVQKNSLPNAALFVGTRGTGKTTVARILSKMVNCEHPGDDGEPCCKCDSCRAIQEGNSTDVLELDAASNNGVEDIRKIIGLLEYKTLGKKRVVILDEVHMLSTGAFNALLKVLEEPPKNTMFILCTTEAHKVPATVVSRCRKLQFHSLGVSEIVTKLGEISTKYHVEASNSALELVAKAANGSMRDAESIFEPFLSEPVIEESYVRQVLGFSSMERIITIIDSIRTGDVALAKCSLDEACAKGENLMCLLEDVINALLEMVSVRLGGDITDVNPSLAEIAVDFTEQRLFDIIAGCRSLYEAKPTNLSIAFLSMLISLMVTESTVSRLEKEVEELKTTLQNGMVVSAASVPNYPSDDATVSEGWEAINEPSPFDAEEQDLPLAKNKAENEPVEEGLPKEQEMDEETLAALVKAGFVVDVSVPVKKEKPEVAVVQEEDAKEEETPEIKPISSDETNDFFGEFSKLFQM